MAGVGWSLLGDAKAARMFRNSGSSGVQVQTPHRGGSTKPSRSVTVGTFFGCWNAEIISATAGGATRRSYRRDDWTKLRAPAIRPGTLAPQNPATPPNKAFPSGIKLLHEPENATIEYAYRCSSLVSLSESHSIVSVYGLNGNREKTWTANHTSEPQPKLL